MARQGLVTIGEAPVDVQVDARTMSAYFSAMCAAGRTEDGPLSGGILWKKGLCGLCQVMGLEEMVGGHLMWTPYRWGDTRHGLLMGGGHLTWSPYL